MPEFGSDKHLAASWIVEPGLTFGTVSLDFTLKYKVTNNGKEEKKWFYANFLVEITEPKVESASEFNTLLAGFTADNALEVTVANEIAANKWHMQKTFNLKMNEKLALHLKSPTPEANVWFDYYESHPGLMVGGVEADGLQQTDGTYSFFREGKVADGVTFGTAWFYFTLGYATDQDNNPLTEAEIANFYGFDSLEEIGDVEEAFEELASYGAPCDDFWDQILKFFDENCETIGGTCIIKNDDAHKDKLTKFYKAFMQHYMFNHPEDGIPDAEYMTDKEKNAIMDEYMPATMLEEASKGFFSEIDIDKSGTLSRNELEQVLNEPKSEECNDYGDWAGDTPCWDMFDNDIKLIFEDFATSSGTDVNGDQQLNGEQFLTFLGKLMEKFDPNYQPMTLEQMVEEPGVKEFMDHLIKFDYD